MKKLILLLASLTLVFGLAACGPKEITCEDGYVLNEDETECVLDNEDPTISGVEDVSLFIGNAFDQLEGVSASDPEDGDITSDITVSGTVDLNATGDYNLTYSVSDSAGAEVTAERTVSVQEADLVYPSGFYNYKFATTELRHTFMAAAEKYLMNNMFAGVPLFANGSFNLYSSRLQLPVDEFVPVMGYGTGFATMSADDSNVLMEDGELGNAGEYTYRTSITTNPGTFNQWLYDTSTDSTLMTEYYGTLYDYVFNEDKTGYDVIPSMATELPQPQDARVTDTGKTVAKTWQITVREDLEWFYRDDTDTSMLPEGHEVIDANDFVETYKLALDEQWFRAISGGGDFVTSSQKVLNAQEYIDGEVEWEDVGINLVDDNTIEFIFVDEQSEWNVRYWAGSFVMTPINIELYNALEPADESDQNPYGTEPDKIAYHGPYYISYYEADKTTHFAENPNFHMPDLYFFTGKTFTLIEDPEIRFQEFINGKLEGVTLPTSKYEDYKNHPGLKQVPGATTFRVMINGLGTVEEQREQFPDSTWVPEPILANQDFKMSMFFSIDRQKLAEDVLKTSTTNMYLFSDAYLVDPQKGIPYRATEQGQTVGEGLSPSTNGYNFDAAQALFKKAVADEIAAGNYTAGTADEYTVIEIEFNYFSGSDAQVKMFEYLEQAFEASMVDDENYVKVDLTGHTKDFPAIYYDYMMIGEFDLSIGGISGSTLDAASFLDTYSSDNRSGFTLNWGIDTGVAEVPVVYNDFEGNRHNEMWSFDAIVSALNGEIFLADGEEAEVPAAKDFTHTPTTTTFTIAEALNSDYVNLTYTVQSYDLDEGYLDVEGMVNIPVPEGEDTITLEGLDPYFYGYDEAGNLIYQGDYQVIINFDYVADPEKDGQTTAPWFTTEELFSSFEPTPALDSVEVAYEVNTNDYARTIDTVVVYDAEGVISDVASVDMSVEGTLNVTGLTEATTYTLVITFDDGLVAYKSITTDTTATE
ncbi:MAG: DUF5011 domain-containing protein [Candidatus Izimaplasma sp.]|nr:DUF5011 domain-containing protein [Candidatus Izimaplasma bacterium]